MMPIYKWNANLRITNRCIRFIRNSHNWYKIRIVLASYGRKPAGFGMIEVVVGTALITMFLFGIAEVGKIASRVIDSASLRLQAAFILEEGVEAVKGRRDSGWAANIALLTLDSDYWLNFSGGTWTLTLTPQPFVDQRFDRRVRISAGRRNASDDLVDTGGTIDSDTKKITVSVAWFERGATTTATISTYITNLFSN